MFLWRSKENFHSFTPISFLIIWNTECYPRTILRYYSYLEVLNNNQEFISHFISFTVRELPCISADEESLFEEAPCIL